MPDEPQRDIEKTLKAYADKRRAEGGEPRALHPATRRLLQGEVARVRKPASDSAGFWSQRWRNLWPNLAIGATAVVVLGATLLIFESDHKSQPQSATMQMASAPATLREAPAARKLDNANRSEETKAPAGAAKSERHIVTPLLGDIPANQPKRVAMLPPASPAPEPAQTQEGFALKTPDTLGASVASEKKAAEREAGIDAPVVASTGVVTNTVNLALDKDLSSTAKFAPVNRNSSLAPRAPQSTGQTFAASTPTRASILAPSPAPSISGATFDSTTSAPATVATGAASAPGTSGGQFYANVDQFKQNGGEQNSVLMSDSLSQMNMRNFVQQPALAKSSTTAKKSKAATVLQNFRLEIIGNKVRIVDRDGSVYTGNWEQPVLANEMNAPSQQNAAANTQTFSFSDNNGVASQSTSTVNGNNSFVATNGPILVTNYFRVTGTNRSLRRKVDFTGNVSGNMIPLLSNGAQQQQAFGGRQNANNNNANLGPQVNQNQQNNATRMGLAGNAQNTVSPQTQLQNLQIMGHALIGTNQLEIKAKAEDLK